MIRRAAVLASCAALAVSSMSLFASAASASGAPVTLVLSAARVYQGELVTAKICNGKVPTGYHVVIESRSTTATNWRVVFQRAVPAGATCISPKLRQNTVGTFLFKGLLAKGPTVVTQTSSRKLVVAKAPTCLSCA